MKRIETKELDKLNRRKQAMFALFCANQVKHLLNGKGTKQALKAIATVEKYLEGKATKEDCKQAAAYAAAYAADAAYAAAYAADAAAYAADAAADAAYAAIYAAAYATIDLIELAEKAMTVIVFI